MPESMGRPGGSPSSHTRGRDIVIPQERFLTQGALLEALKVTQDRAATNARLASEADARAIRLQQENADLRRQVEKLTTDLTKTKRRLRVINESLTQAYSKSPRLTTGSVQTGQAQTGQAQTEKAEKS